MTLETIQLLRIRCDHTLFMGATLDRSCDNDRTHTQRWKVTFTQVLYLSTVMRYWLNQLFPTLWFVTISCVSSTKATFLKTSHMVIQVIQYFTKKEYLPMRTSYFLNSWPLFIYMVTLLGWPCETFLEPVFALEFLQYMSDSVEDIKGSF